MRPASEASQLVAFGIPGIAAVMAIALIVLVQRVRPQLAARFAGGVLLIAAAEFGLADTGLLARADFMPPAFLLMMIPLTMITVRTALSGVGSAIIDATPLWLLVMLEGFRLPLELLMHRAATERIMPPQMTWTGLNFDVVTGATALFLGIYLFLSASRDGAPRKLVLAWSAMGLGLLLAVVVIALLSMPAFAWFGPDRTNEWITHVPFVWLPGILVETALFLHILILRKLAQARRAAR
jgi:hypothetical protein